MDKKDQWQQARSKDSCEAGTLVAFSSQVSKGSWRPSFLRILFIRVRLIRETKTEASYQETACAGFGSKHELMKGLTWGLLLSTERLCTALRIDLYKATLTNVYVLYIILESMQSNLKKGAIDIVSLPCIYVKTSLHGQCTFYSILHFPFYSLNNSLQWLSQRHPTIVELYYYFFLENTFLKQIIKP